MTLADMRGQGAPADIGTFQVPTGIMVFQHTFSGVNYICATRAGDRGWVLVDHRTVSAANNVAVLNAALALGREVFVAQGTYLLGASLTINVIYTNLVGEGWGTILRLDTGVNDANITLNADYCSVRNLQIDGNYLNQGGGLPKGLEVLGGVGLVAEDLYIHDTYNEGIIAQNPSSYGIISHCYVSTTRLSGIAIYGTAGGIVTHYVVSDCLVYNAGIAPGTGDGIFFQDCTQCVCGNCVVDTCTPNNAIEVHALTQNSWDIVISNIVSLNCPNGIFLLGTDATHKVYNVIASGFTIYNTTHIGLYAQTYVQDSTFCNGVVDTTGATAATDKGGFASTNTTRIHFADIHFKNCCRGIQLTTSTCVNPTVVSCYVFDSVEKGILVDSSCSGASVKNCFLRNNVGGIHFTAATGGGQIVGNTILASTGTGLSVSTSDKVHVVGNWVEGTTGAYNQLSIATSNNCTVQNNYILDTASGQQGINCAASNRTLITNNYIWNTTLALRNGITLWASAEVDDNVVEGNYFYQCATPISITAAFVTRTRVLRNFFIACTAPFLTDTGTDTILATARACFVKELGTAAWIVTAASAMGIDIDAADEGALAKIKLPQDLQQVVRIKVWGTAQVTEADHMTLLIAAGAGGDNESWTGEAIAVAGKLSDTVNFTALDNIQWTFTAADDADIGHLTAGDFLQWCCYYNAAAGVDCATDLLLAGEGLEIQYV